MPAIVISSGHGKHVQGADEYINEVKEARRVVDRVAELLRADEVEVEVFHDDQSDDQDENLKRICDTHNSFERRLDVSVHFNAYAKTSKPMGTECWYVTQQEMASEVSRAIAAAGDFIDRGDKHTTGLYFLNHTEAPAILIEVCFCDSTSDVEHYKKHFPAICKAIADTIGVV